ncbi:MAG: exonuclease domain-containing protein [Lachnospiraceae bacterium]|jgi:DNA polymerase III epsilon subunit-like protein|nr:exonuclease domain-containing protein [Lachnospiraceae bacterium]
MNYIILDLEWNQGSGTGAGTTVKELPFEVIDIGAIKLDQNRYIISEFNQLVKPSVYTRMHYMTGRIIHLQMRDLMKGNPFLQVMTQFLEWCGDDYIFCTWGSTDLVELQRNMRYYFMSALSSGPLPYLDVQKLFSIAYEDRKSRRSLESAIDFLRLPKDIPFHRAFSDAYYTAKILSVLPEGVLGNHSYDFFTLPAKREEEIHVRFENYHKYISAEFSNRQAAISDREVMSTRCYLCAEKRNLKRKIKWFSNNGKHFLCVSYCPVHGFMKSKLRLKKSENGGVFVVKTSKMIEEKNFLEIREKKEKKAEALSMTENDVLLNKSSMENNHK